MSSIGQFRDTLIPSTVHNARKLRFYEELWQHAEPERVRTVDDLSLLPVMDRVDYTERFHLFWTEEMLGRPFLVTHTSGTTGDPLYRYRSEEELDYIRRFFAAIHRSRGLSSRDRAVSVDTTNADAPHGGAIRIPHPGPLLHVPMDVPADIENVVEVLATPHRVEGELRFVEELNMGMRQFVILTSFLAERGVDPKHALHVRRVRTSGGYLNAGAVRRISAFWDLFVGDQFSLSEIFGGAWKCSTCGWYHPDPFIAAEVVDHRTGDRISQGVGVLVLTELYPFVQTHPFIRYWTGDVVETVATGCEKSSLSFRYLGRTYARCGQTVRGPLRPKVKHASHGAILDGEGGLLVCPGPVMDFLGDQEGIARCGVWSEVADPLGLGRPRFALQLEPGRPPVLRLWVSVDSPHEVDPALVRRLHAVLLHSNPALATRFEQKSLTIDVALVDTAAEPTWADEYRNEEDARALWAAADP
jgi:hypothetical protein